LSEAIQFYKKIRIFAPDLYTYSPGLPIDVIATSDDFHGLCLMADEHVTIEAPSMRDLVHLAYLPIVQLHEPP
jgi:hypothetical protein